jgi:glycerate dehydrogenase
MFILMLRRNAAGYREDLQAGRWAPPGPFSLMDRPIFDVIGSTIGLVGYGAIAKKVEGLAAAFGMNVLIAERKGRAEVRPGRTRFEEVLQGSDIVSLHSPLTPDTRGLIGTPELSMMKPSAILINTARGALLDEAALATALRGGVIAGAGIDVLSEEPPQPDHPLIAYRAPNLIVTPHNAWASRQAMQRLADILVGNLEAFVTGRPVNVVV